MRNENERYTVDWVGIGLACDADLNTVWGKGDLGSHGIPPAERVKIKYVLLAYSEPMDDLDKNQIIERHENSSKC